MMVMMMAGQKTSTEEREAACRSSIVTVDDVVSSRTSWSGPSFGCHRWKSPTTHRPPSTYQKRNKKKNKRFPPVVGGRVSGQPGSTSQKISSFVSTTVPQAFYVTQMSQLEELSRYPCQITCRYLAHLHIQYVHARYSPIVSYKCHECSLFSFSFFVFFSSLSASLHPLHLIIF